MGGIAREADARAVDRLQCGRDLSNPIEKVKAISPMIKRVIEEHQKARFDLTHFKSFGDFGSSTKLPITCSDPITIRTWMCNSSSIFDW